MTYLDAAYHILHQAGHPLRYEDITEHALAQQLISPQDPTPEATMASRLYIDTLQEGSRFTRVDKGTFGLVDWRPADIEAQVQRIRRSEATRDQLREKLHAMPPDRFEAPTVTSLRGSLQVYQQGIIITTSDFSRGAREDAAAANKTRVGLINGRDLLELLIRHKVGVVEKALKVISLDEEWWGELAGADTPAPAASTPEPASTPATLPDGPGAGDGKSRLAAKKPASFTFLDQSYPVASWRALLVTLCEIMAELHPDNFVTQALTVRGLRRHHIAAAPDDMINPVPIGATGLWLEANQSSRTAQRVVELILRAFAYADDDLELVIQQ